MKKALLSALIFFACMLSACGGEHSVSGRIVEADTDPGVGLVSFVVRTDRDKEVGILLTDETHIFTFVDGPDADTFREMYQKDFVCCRLSELDGELTKLLLKFSRS